MRPFSLPAIHALRAEGLRAFMPMARRREYTVRLPLLLTTCAMLCHLLPVGSRGQGAD